MIDKYFIRALDYREGDIVQIRPDGLRNSGRIGIIIGINSHKGGKNELVYEIKLSDNERFTSYPRRMRLIRAAGSDTNEEHSEFFK